MVEVKIQQNRIEKEIQHVRDLQFSCLQYRRKLGNWWFIFIYSCYAQLTSLKSIYFMVCEHKYMSPQPNYRASYGYGLPIKITMTHKMCSVIHPYASFGVVFLWSGSDSFRK